LQTNEAWVQQCSGNFEKVVQVTILGLFEKRSFMNIAAERSALPPLDAPEDVGWVVPDVLSKHQRD